MFYWLREVAGLNLRWVYRPKDSGRGVILETVTRGKCPEVHVWPKEAVKARVKAAGVGSFLVSNLQ